MQEQFTATGITLIDGTLPSAGSPSDTATYTFVVSGTTSEGEVSVSVNSAEDADGNTQTESFSYISPFSKVTIDRTTPTVSSKTLTTSNSDNTKAFLNDVLTLTVETNEEVTLPLATIAGKEENFVRDISAVGNIAYTGAHVEGSERVFVQGDYAYVVSNNEDALQIIDISTPSAPTAVGRIDNTASGTLLDEADTVFVQGDYAYVTSFNNDALQIINISNPSAPTAAGNISHGGDIKLDGAYDVFVQGNYAYVISQNSHALQIIDISNPADPQARGNIDDTATDTKLNDPRGIFVRGDYAYIASFNSDALQIINISDPTTPTVVGNISGSTLLDGVRSVFVQGNYAYVISERLDALQIIDISNPADPQARGNISSSTLFDDPRGIFVRGDYAYIASYRSNALQIINISDSAAPTLAGNISHSGSALLDGAIGIFVRGNYAYVGSNSALQILELENTYTAKSKVDSSSTNGAASYNFGKPIDVSGNEGTITSPTATAIIVDKTQVGGGTTAPTPTIISLSSDGDNPRYAKVGDTVTLTVTYDEEVVSAGTVTATGITLIDGTLPSAGSPSDTATYTFVCKWNNIRR